MVNQIDDSIDALEVTVNKEITDRQNQYEDIDNEIDAINAKIDNYKYTPT